MRVQGVSDESATFLASFAPILTSIKVHGSREGMRIQLDIPESEMGNAMSLFLWRERVLEVTVRPQGDGKNDNSRL